MKLLILTSEYPNPNSTFDTPVVHYYAKEWVQLGHEVRVVHFRSVFPAGFYFFAKLLKQTLKKIFQTDFVPIDRLNKRVEFIHEGIEVISQPIFKMFPHFKFFDRTIKEQAKIIHQDDLNKKFMPDVILTHFVNPQLALISELKKYYPNAKTSLVLHEKPKVIDDLFGASAPELLADVDYIGFRFNEMRTQFINLFGERKNLFICPSGIPERYIVKEISTDKFKNERMTFCFVGMLIPLKNIEVLLEAFSMAFPNRNCDLKIIGEGMLEGKLRNKIEELDLASCVSMQPKISRDAVQAVLTHTDVFVMVSKPEAFGLVYLEAMSKGCITVGTKGQGIDGVILDGINGFLCTANNVEELSYLLKKIVSLSLADKQLISRNAHLTASELTDQKVAVSYLEKIGLMAF